MRNALPVTAHRVALPAVLLCLVATVCGLHAPARAAGDLIEQAHEKYLAADLAGARALLLEQLKTEPARFVALHRLARIESELADDARGEEQRNLAASAVGHARAAVKAAPDSAEGHLELAVALGRQALKEGPRTQLSLSREIKSEVDRALTLDPSLSRAWHVRAIWNRKLSTLNFVSRGVANAVLGGVPKGASMDNAVADLRKAVELEPAYVNHHLELGRTYQMLKRNDEARLELERAISLPPTSNPRDPKYQVEARELLARLKKG